MVDEYPPFAIQYHPTPSDLVAELARMTVRAFCPREAGEPTKVLDLFAGDGRLGLEVCAELERRGITCRGTMVDINTDRAVGRKELQGWAVRQENGYTFRGGKFDIVVLNPPFLRLTVRATKALGVTWDEASLGGQNAYGVAMVAAIRCTRPGGVVGLVAPFGWLRGQRSRKLRDWMGARAELLSLRPLDRSGVFADVQQDVALQIFRVQTPSQVASQPSAPPETHSTAAAGQCGPRAAVPLVRASVGPVVWNRERHNLVASARNGVPLVYGGNIRSDHQLKLPMPKYRARQYFRRAAAAVVPNVVGDAVLLRRTLRGRPGAWTLDWCLLPRSMRVVCENHVIVIEVLDAPAGFDLEGFGREVADTLLEYYGPHGSPNIAVGVVRRLLGGLLVRFQ